MPALAVDTVDNHPREMLDVLAAATADLFQGKNVTQIEALWNQYRGASEGGNYFKEILINSDNLVHLFLRSTSNPEVTAVIVCTRQVSIGMLFAQARAVLKEYDAAG